MQKNSWSFIDGLTGQTINTTYNGCTTIRWGTELFVDKNNNTKKKHDHHSSAPHGEFAAQLFREPMVGWRKVKERKSIPIQDLLN